MLDKIEKLTWDPKLEKYFISESDINDDNELINHYNSIPTGNKVKLLIGELLYLSHPKSFGDIVGINLGIPLKENLTIDEEERLLYLSRLVSKISRKIDKIIS